MPQPTAEAPHSEPRMVTTQSSRLWGLDWSVETPWSFDGITVATCSFDALDGFMRAHFDEIFGRQQGGRFLDDPMSAAKSRFCREMDVFVFRDGDVDVGVLAGHPTDWSTYYMRTAAFLPAYRDRRLLTRAVEKLYGPLAAVGCERIEGEAAPSNAAMMRMLTNLGWIVTSTSNSERWGTTLRFTKFLRESAEDVFARQFCGVRLKSTRTGGEPAASAIEERRAT
jgi:hypothetical protein